MNLRGDGALFISRAEGKKGPDGASKQPLKTSQAPGTHSLLREASSYIVSNIQNALTHDIQYDLVYTTFDTKVHRARFSYSFKRFIDT